MTIPTRCPAAFRNHLLSSLHLVLEPALMQAFMYMRFFMLSISIHTVTTHRRNISSKLQIHSIAGITIYAIANGLVRMSEIYWSDLP